MTSTSKRESRGGPVVAALIVGVNVVVLVLLVVMGTRHEQPPAFVPTPPGQHPAEGRLVGPTIFTVDATVPDRWRFFSFDSGTVVTRPTPLGWDLAFRRFEVIANGGDGFAGKGGVIDLGEIPFADVRTLPASGYVENVVGGDTLNSAVRKWYDYSFLSHILSPKPRVYAVRTAVGRYAKLQFAGYYCPGATPGCVTFRYVFQGGGGVDLADPPGLNPSP